MQHFEDNVTDQYGNAKDGASVLVSLNGSPATLYSDNGVTPKVNPLTTDSSGTFEFRAANGTYTLTSGAGSTTVTLFDPDDLSISDGALHVPVFLNTTPDGYAKRGETSQVAGPHIGDQWSGKYIGLRPVGSGQDGPDSADIGLTISNIKQSPSTTTEIGELDGLQIVIRNGGTGDAGGIMANVAHYGTGFSAFAEAVTSLIELGVITQSIDTQIAVVDNQAGGAYYGYVATKTTGAGGNGFYSQSASSSANAWDSHFTANRAGLDVFRVLNNGNIELTAASGATPKKTIRSSTTGKFGVLNNADVEVMALDDVGALVIAGDFSCVNIDATGHVKLTAASGSNPAKTIRSLAGSLSVLSDADVEIFNLTNAGALSLGAGLTCATVKSSGYLALFDGMVAPSVVASHAALYVDVADGDLKVKFSDGTIKTIVVDT